MTATATIASRRTIILWQKRLLAALRLLVVAAGSLFFVMPTAWMITTSVKPDHQVWLIPPVWIPEYFVWDNYAKPWIMLPFPRFYVNTTLIVTLNVVGVLLSSGLIAYGFARLRFPGRDAIFMLVLSTLMLPAHVTLIPQYLLFSKLKWVNTFLPLTLHSYFGGAFHIFLLRQFMATISRDLDDAAKMDGAGFLGIYWRILLPLCRPALGVVAINTVTQHWNDFIHPLIYLQKQNLFTISLGLRFIQGNYFGDWPVQYVMSMTFLSVIPIVILFFFAQRYFLRGIVITSFR